LTRIKGDSLSTSKAADCQQESQAAHSSYGATRFFA